MAEERRFDPEQHLMKLPQRIRTADGAFVNRTADYLEVKWRLVWFRQDHPDGRIRTKLELLTDEAAVVFAEVSLPDGAVATGHARETPQGFRDYVEKAETSAIGRALAALGYGTQFTYEFSDGADLKLADAPVTPPTRAAARQFDEAPPPAEDRGRANFATDPQINAIRKIAQHARGWSSQQVDQFCRERYQRGVQNLTKAEASALIDELKAEN